MRVPFTLVLVASFLPLAAVAPAAAEADAVLSGWSVAPIPDDCDLPDGRAPLRGSPQAPDLPGEPRAGTFLVRPIVLVPSDVAADAEKADDLARWRAVLCPTLGELQRWYRDAAFRSAAASITFAFQRPIEITTDKTTAWFACNAEPTCRSAATWSNVNRDLADKGYSAWATVNRVNVVFVAGGGDTALGASSGDGLTRAPGMALLTDLQLAAFGGECAAAVWWCPWGDRAPRDMAMGATAHELGHGFGLPHPEGVCVPHAAACVLESHRRSSSVMYHWWDFPRHGNLRNAGFNPDEVATLAKNRMFEPVPPRV